MIPVIICGGAGTRLWPVSREAHPKPLIRLADGQSLVQKTFLRCAQLRDVRRVLTVTSRDTYLPIKAACAEVNAGATRVSFLLEPSARNTTAAIAAAALWVRHHHGADVVMLVLPADHLIEPQSEFARAVESARHAAEKGSIVTFGIKPTGPETGYGYIEYERASELAPGVHQVRRFVEKPQLEVARQLVDSGDYLWNSGMFCFTAGTILAEIAAFAPDVLAQVEKAVAAGSLVDGSDNSCLELDEAAFAQVRSISVDYAVMEQSSRVAVVPSSMQWSDIGSWTSLSELLTPDEQGNRLQGQVLVHSSTNCYADSPHRVLGVVGVSNLVIVDTPDALLVADASQVQDVKQIVAQLKERQHEAAKFHRYAEHAWGSSTLIDSTGQFETRRVIVNPGAVWHGVRDQAQQVQLMVLRGKGELITAAGSVTVDPLHCASVDPARHHEVHNATREELVLLAIRHRSAPEPAAAAPAVRAVAR